MSTRSEEAWEWCRSGRREGWGGVGPVGGRTGGRGIRPGTTPGTSDVVSRWNPDEDPEHPRVSEGSTGAGGTGTEGRG